MLFATAPQFQKEKAEGGAAPDGSRAAARAKWASLAPFQWYDKNTVMNRREDAHESEAYYLAAGGSGLGHYVG